jgi:alkanesulfonate monooxygenase SsuD/methylene tetrahydromethanopterin reductase-like flavin-dependent oxidoreductase (luciferase family)
MSDALQIGTLVLPNEPWPELVARWRRLDDAGLDSIWSCDHFTNPHKPGAPWFEGWTSLVGMATSTRRARIGLLVGAIVSRSPALYAKEAQTVDHASGGRLNLGLGAGGAPTDQPMWGADDWPPLERAERFVEYVELVHQLVRGEEVTAQGRWYRTTGAVMTPGFLQAAPPLVLAAHGRRTLDVTARRADVWNTFGPTLEAARENSRRLDEACERANRDPAQIRRSALVGLFEGTAWTSAAEFADLVHRWFDAGFGEVVFYDPPYARPGVARAGPGVIDELLGTTLPRLREQLA